MSPVAINRLHAIGIAAIVLIPLLAGAQDDASSRCTIAPVQAELDFTLKDMQGADVTLSDYAGNVILLDFWATWCAPCRIEIPGFIEMVNDYGDRGFVVLGVSIDDAPDALQLYAEELGMNYPVLIGDGRDDIKTSYGPLIGFPTSFIIDRNGTICHKHTGYAPKDAFVREIEDLL
jgi:thiol-disulfide isomerase/thioredoxin